MTAVTEASPANAQSMTRVSPAGAMVPAAAISSTCFSWALGKPRMARMSFSLPRAYSSTLAPTCLGSCPRRSSAYDTHRTSSNEESPPSRLDSSPLAA